MTSDGAFADRLSIEQVDAIAEDLVARDVVAGVQVAIATDGRSNSVTAGSGSPGRAVLPSTVFPMFCSTKPIMSLAISRLCASGAIAWDRPIGDVCAAIDRHPSLRELTVADVLDHRIGAWEPTLAEYFFRTDVTDPLGFLDRSHGDVGTYNDFATAHLLELILDAATVSGAVEQMSDLVGGPCAGGPMLVGSSSSEVPENERGTLYWRRRGSLVPLHALWTPMVLDRIGPSTGGYWSAAGLASFYLKHGPELAALAKGSDGLFAGGTMTQISQQLGLQSGTQVVGHHGWFGSSVGYWSPDHQIGVAIVMNTLFEDMERAFSHSGSIAQAIEAEAERSAP